MKNLTIHKWVLLFTMAVVLHSTIFAQQRFTLTSFGAYNLYNLNPARAGRDGCIELNLQHKNQWTQLEGKPVNYLMQGHMGVGEGSGVGVQLNIWKAGLIQNSVIGLTYAKHIPVGDKAKLGLGLTANYMNQRIDAGSAVVFGTGDMMLNSGTLQSNGLVLDAGLLLSTDKLNIGISSPQVWATSMNLGVAASSGYLLERQYLAHVSYEFPVGESMKFIPMVVTRMVPRSSSLLEFNNRFMFGNFFGVGLGMRTNKSLLGSVNLNVNDKLQCVYAFDLFNNSTNTLPGLTHEIMLSLKICKDNEKFVLKIQQEDKSFEEEEFKSYSSLTQHVSTVRKTDEELAARIEEEINKNPEANEFVVLYPEPYTVILEGEKYEFKTLKEMNTFLKLAKKNDPVLHDRLKSEIDDSELSGKDEPISIDVVKKQMEFRKLAELEEYLVTLETESPGLAAEIRTLMEGDNNMIIVPLTDQMKFTNLMKDAGLYWETEGNVVLKDHEVKNEEVAEKIDEEEKPFDLKTAEIYFDFNKSELIPQHERVLNNVAAELKSNPSLKVTIIGHSCNVGTPESIYWYSFNRAKNVKAYLVKRGIKASRIKTKAQADELINKSGNQTDPAKYRRVDFKLY